MRRLLTILGLLAFWSGNLAAQSAWDGYRDDDRLTHSLREALAGKESLARLGRLTESGNGRTIWTVEIARTGGTPVDQRPGLLLLSNLSGDRPVADEVLASMIEKLLAEDLGEERMKKLLDEHVLYCVLRPNPDATRSFFTAPRQERRRNATPTDDDRDGRTDEDGPDDLDGDGVITWMRVPDPAGDWLIDSEDGRKMRKPDAEKGERGTHRLVIEGKDDDGDEQVNEDAAGGVDLSRNFAHAWQEHDRATGDYPNCERETHALIEWVLARPNIAAVLVLDRHDNLVNPPKASSRGGGGEAPGGGGRGRRGAREPETQVQSQDVSLYTEASEQFKKLLGVEKADPEPADGAFFEWAYFQFGVPAFASRVWYGPGPEKTEEAADEEEGSEESAPSAPRRGGRARSGSRGGDDADRETEWLAWNERALNGAGFVAWKAFDHPDLGEVEIGGWKPFVKTNPPASEIPALADAHLGLLHFMAEQFGHIAIQEVEVEDHGSGLYTVKAVLTNDGRLPTAIRQGQMNREVLPVRVDLELHGQELILGEKMSSINSLDGRGGREELTWMIRGEPGSRVTLSVRSQKAGRARQEVRLDG
ncbi:MAG: M14 family zinc carboxypeptidase [Planctomycetota bacterium]